MVGAFLFPVGIQVTVLQPTDDELNAALNMAYGNEPLMPLALLSPTMYRRKGRLGARPRRWRESAAGTADELRRGCATNRSPTSEVQSLEGSIQGVNC